jgi:hypothetical protein
MLEKRPGPLEGMATALEFSPHARVNPEEATAAIDDAASPP